MAGEAAGVAGAKPAARSGYHPTLPGARTYKSAVLAPGAAVSPPPEARPLSPAPREAKHAPRDLVGTTVLSSHHIPVAKLSTFATKAEKLEAQVATELNALMDDPGKLTINSKNLHYSLVESSENDVAKSINYDLRSADSEMRIAIDHLPNNSITITYGKIKSEKFDSLGQAIITFDKIYTKSNIGTLADRIEVQMKREENGSVYNEAHERFRHVKDAMQHTSLGEITNQLPKCNTKDRAHILHDLNEIVGGHANWSEQSSEVVLYLSRYSCSGYHETDVAFYSDVESLQGLERKREEILKEYGIASDTKHPFLETLKTHVPIRDIDTFKSSASYLQTEIFKKYGLFAEGRTFIGLIPAAGSKLSTLLVAISAMDEDFIDSAEFIYTEIRPIYISRLHAQLKILQDEKFKGKNIIQNYRHEIKEFSAQQGGGLEVKFTFQYLTKKGLPKDITLTFALNRSGKNYFRQDQVEKANIVIWDDTSMTDMEFALQNRRSNGPQLVMVEKSDLLKNLENINMRKKYKSEIIKAQYGHCEDKQYILSQDGSNEWWSSGGQSAVEYKSCQINNAVLFKLPAHSKNGQ